ncbi:MAG: DLW-39 family protein [Candidatus Nanopelagicales bacterium]
MFKKLLVLTAIAAAGYVVYNRATQAQEERDLWNEATSSPDVP